MTRPVVVRYVPRRTLIVWVAIVGLTLVTWAVGAGHAFSASTATASVLAFALIKVHFIGSGFMELRHAPRAMAVAFDAYLVVVYLALMTMYALM